jgi:hypothetical protein
MHRMTRDIASATVQAPFDGRTFRFKDDRIVLETRGRALFMKLAGNDYRITRVIGGHHREDFVGLGPEGNELVMPVSWLIASRKLRYKGYSVMTRARPYLRAGPVWSETCIFCHNTEPYLLDLLGALTVGKTPAYQGEIVDPLLPAPRRWQYRISDPVAFTASIGDEMERIGGRRASGDLDAVVKDSIASTRTAFGGSDLIEVGIGCEACHGSRAHVKNPKSKTSLVPRAPFLSIDGPKTNADAINRTCARCHQVLFTRYPYTWEGGLRTDPIPGGSHINSGEARDFLLGGCASQLACTACHDPHGDDNHARSVHLETKAGDAICTGCHGKYAEASALRAHAHHDPDQAGARCMACHMPKKNMSLASALTRYHRIASPTDRVKVLRDRPLECALCHPKENVDTLVRTMETWWGKQYDRTGLEALYGKLDQPAMFATLARGRPHEKAVALFVLGEQKDKNAAAMAASELVNEYPLVRGYAETALEKILGAPSPIDLAGGTDDEIARAAATWVGK